MKQELAFLAPKKMAEYRMATEGAKTTNIKDYEYAQKNPDFAKALQGKNTGLSGKYKAFLSAHKLENNKENYKKFEDSEVEHKKKLVEVTKNRPYLADLMAKGEWLPSGRMTEPLMDAFEAAVRRSHERGKPLTGKDLRKMDFEAQKARATGRTAGGRLPLSRKQNVQSGRVLLQEMNETSKKIDFSTVKLKGAFEQFKKGQLQDPIFAEYMAQRADALFVITAAMKMNGVTDKAIEIEEEAFPVNSSHRVFTAWFNTQMRALNRAAYFMNEDFDYGIEEVPTYPAGQGGAPTEAHPFPTLEEQQHKTFPKPTQASLERLKNNPHMIKEFEAMFGFRPEGY